MDIAANNNIHTRSAVKILTDLATTANVSVKLIIKTCILYISLHIPAAIFSVFAFGFSHTVGWILLEGFFDHRDKFIYNHSKKILS